jgi:hypothetical protein
MIHDFTLIIPSGLFCFKPDEAVLLAWMLHIERNKRDMASINEAEFNGWFHYPQENIMKDINISKHIQNRIIKNFKKRGILSVKRSNTMPTHNLYKINIEKLQGILY